MDLGSSIRRRRTRVTLPASDGVAKGARVVGWATLVAVVGLAFGYVVATTVFFPAPEPPPALQGVPELRGSVMESASAAVADSGLVVGQVDSVRHPTVPRGMVIGQSPLPGRTALPGAEVRITVSSGPEVRPVPDVSRLRGDRASIVLGAGGFTVTVDTVESDAPAGRVVSVDPPPGTELALPGDVQLMVSLGPPPFPMPRLVGLEERDAIALLDSLGLILSEVETRLSLRNGGEVVDQVPEADSVVELGTAVRLVVGEDPRRRRRNDR